jgi:hypothetical protein
MRPGNRYAREAAARRTLADLANAKIELVAICRRCKHRRVLFTANLLARYGEGMSVRQLQQRLRCGSCGGQVTNLQESSR